MKAFSLGLRSAIVARQFSVSFSDVIVPAATFGESSPIVISALDRVFEILVRRIIPVGGAQLRGGFRQAVKGGNQIRQATLFRVRLGERQPLSYCHVRFTDTETPSPTCRNDV